MRNIINIHAEMLGHQGRNVIPLLMNIVVLYLVVWGVKIDARGYRQSSANTYFNTFLYILISRAYKSDLGDDSGGRTFIWTN
jgi:hypothetical protein